VAYVSEHHRRFRPRFALLSELHEISDGTHRRSARPEPRFDEIRLLAGQIRTSSLTKNARLPVAAPLNLDAAVEESRR
jgi:hypothetical protein